MVMFLFKHGLHLLQQLHIQQRMLAGVGILMELMIIYALQTMPHLILDLVTSLLNVGHILKLLHHSIMYWCVSGVPAQLGFLESNLH